MQLSTRLIRARDREAGVTLVELLVVMVIFGVIGAITVASLTQGLRSSAQSQARLDTIADLQQVQVAITRQLRSSCPVTVISDYQTVVKLDRDGVIERHDFSLATGSTEIREAVHSWDPVTSTWVAVRDRVIATDITNRSEGIALFTGLNDDGVATTVAANVNVFTVRLVRPLSGAPDPVALDTTIARRNGDLPCPNTTP